MVSILNTTLGQCIQAHRTAGKDQEDHTGNSLGIRAMHHYI